MIAILQMLGLFIPAIFIVLVYGHGIAQCNAGKGNEPVPAWLIFLIELSLFIFAFTLGTILSPIC